MILESVIKRLAALLLEFKKNKINILKDINTDVFFPILMTVKIVKNAQI